MMSMGWARGLGWGLLAWCLGVALQLQQAALWPVALYGAVLGMVAAAAWFLRFLALRRLSVQRHRPTGLWVLGSLLWFSVAFALT